MKQVKPRLKVHLLKGKSITHNQAQKMWGTNRLAEYVRRLRKDGMDIDMDMIRKGNDVYGKYYLA